LAAKIEPPKRVYGHGWILSGDEKMSKSKGNILDPLEIINVLEDKPTSQRCLAERAFLRELEGGCQVPIGVNSNIDDGQLYLTGMVASLDGERLIKDQVIGNINNDPELVGIELAKKLKLKGADNILSEIFEEFRENKN